MRRYPMQLVAAVLTATLMLAACTSSDDTANDAAETVEETAATTTPPQSTSTPGSNAATNGDTEPTTTPPIGSVYTASVGEVGGSGCGTPHGSWDQTETVPNSEVRVAWNEPLLSFNDSTGSASALANSNPLYLMHMGQFSYYDGDLNLVNNDSFGTCVIESLDPLVITYTVNDGVTWSDGTQIDAADLLMAWGPLSGVYSEGNAYFIGDGTAVLVDDEGNLVVDDGTEQRPLNFETDLDENGELAAGVEYVPATGTNFDGAFEGYKLVSQMPEITADGRGLTMTWDSFYVDYPLAAPATTTPAHVIGRLALGIEDPAAAKQAVIDAFADNDAEALAAIAQVWNGGFIADSLPDDEQLYLSSGPYLLTAYDEISQMEFVANPNYTWGPTPLTKNIIYTIISDPEAAVQAMANEEVDIISPQATADLLEQLTGLTARGVEVINSNDSSYEHIDFAAANGGPFDPATYGGDAEAAQKVRTAVMKTIPRQEIVDRLIAPLNPEAKVRNSFVTAVDNPTYQAHEAANGMSEFDGVDIKGARALLDEVGIDELDVRVHFADDNPRRAAQYELMAASAAQAGINLIDGRSATWAQELGDTTIYDMAMFAWSSAAVDVAGTEGSFVTGGASNYYGYSNPTVDALYEELKATTDPVRQQQLLIEIDTELTESGFGLTLFQHPSITAFNSNYVTNIAPIPIAPTIFWNAPLWVPS